MTLILSLQAFTAAHVALSVIGLVCGPFVLREIFASRRPAGWAALFLTSLAATSLSGFMFPFTRLGPGWVIGAISLAVLVPTILACTLYRLAGPWRWIYAVGATVTLYLDVVIAVLQLFAKLPALHAAGTTRLAVAQLAVLGTFATIAIRAVARFHPANPERTDRMPAPVLSQPRSRTGQ